MERDIKPTYDELESYVENLQKQLADAQATIAALQAVIRQMGEQAAVLAKDGMAAKAQVAALQRERDDAVLLRDHNLRRCEALDSKYKKVLADLDAERERYKLLNVERNAIDDKRHVLHEQVANTIEAAAQQEGELAEIQALAANLKSQLSQLQALVRAWGTAHESVDDWFKRAATDENTPTISEFEAVKKVLFDSERALKATLDATTPARWTAEEIEQAKREAKELGKAIGWLDSTAKGGDGE